MNEIALFCEVNKIILPVQDVPMSKQSTKNNLPELYNALRSAKNKAEAIAAFRNFVVFNDIPEDIWEKLEEWKPKK